MSAICVSEETRIEAVDRTMDNIVDFFRSFLFDENTVSLSEENTVDFGLSAGDEAEPTAQPNPVSGEETAEITVADSQSEKEQYNWKESRKNLKSLLLVAAFYIIGVAFYSQYEGWDILTCVYYITISSTTIGYGDYTPTSDHARIFTIFYVFAGVVLVVSVLNSLIEGGFDYVRTIINEKKKKAKILAMKALRLGENSEAAEGQNITEDHMKDRSHHHEREIRHLLKRCLVLVIALLTLILLGAAYFQWAEGWNYTESVYFVYITSMTIGYGDFEVTHPHSRVFMIFYALLSTSMVSTVISSVSSIRVQIAAEKLRQKLLDAKLDTSLIDNMDVDGDDSITKFEYVVVMLVKTGVLDPSKHVTPWVEKFDEMDISGDGELSTQDIIDAMKGLKSNADPGTEKKRKNTAKLSSKLTAMKTSYDDTQ